MVMSHADCHIPARFPGLFEVSICACAYMHMRAPLASRTILPFNNSSIMVELPCCQPHPTSLQVGFGQH